MPSKFNSWHKRFVFTPAMEDLKMYLGGLKQFKIYRDARYKAAAIANDFIERMIRGEMK